MGNFVVPEASIARIMKYLVADNEKGVPKALFQKLKVFVGTAREKELDGKKRALREATEKKLKEAKLALQERIDDASKAIEEVFSKVAKAEAASQSLLGKAKIESASVLLKLA